MLPKFVMIRQNYDADKIENIAEEVVNTMESIDFDLKELSGKTVGIAVGSRGISNTVSIVKTVAEVVRANGGTPIVFAAMGSHGGSTVSGQKEVLESLGVTEESIGAEIQTTTNGILYGITKNGMKVYGNDLAPTYDKIIIINRVKQHTDFEDITESGLFKLMAVGIGNHRGAQSVHSNALRAGYGPVIREMGAYILEKLPIVLGIAITENWRHETNCIQAILPEDLLKTEMELLEKVKASAVKLPMDYIDTLIIEDAGKDISGTCVDTKVVGRIMIPGQEEPKTPKIRTVAVLDFTDESHGNSMGLGVVDLITKRVFNKIDIAATSLTGITSTCLLQAKIPCVADSDLAAIEAAFACTGIENAEEVKAIFIKDTNSLATMAVTQNVYNLIKDNEKIERISDTFELDFDDSGTLITKLDTFIK